MQFVYRLFLTLLSVGFLGFIACVAAVVFIVSFYSYNLPDYRQLQDYKPPVVTRIYAGDGKLMDEFSREKRVFVPIDQIPDRLIYAFLSAEDKNFYDHHGVDLVAIARAVLKNIKNLGEGRRPEGASTITQQVAKNFLLSSKVALERKIKEAIIAYRMENTLSKDRILELYLNEIYLGSRSYGVAAAALQYFDKSLKDLTISECAYLASLPKAPNNYQVHNNYEEALARRNWVIGRMQADNRITQSQAAIAKTKPIEVVDRKTFDHIQAPYFAEEVRRELLARYGEDNLYGGGLSVHTSIDPHIQTIAIRALRNGLMAYDKRHGWRGPAHTLPTTENWRDKIDILAPIDGKPDDWFVAVVLAVSTKGADIGIKDQDNGFIPLSHMTWARKPLVKGYIGEKITSAKQVLNVGDVILVEPVTDKNGSGNTYKLQQIPEIQGAIMAMDPHTGRILAMQGGWMFDKSVFNRATQAWRQPGSAFKPFVYLSALEHGFTPATLVLDAPFVMEQGPGLKKWRPANYSKVYYGPTPIRVGIEKSRNLMTVRLAEFLGMDTIAEYAKKFHVSNNMAPLLANALGASETTLLRLTTAYAMLVNGGREVEPTTIDRIQDRRGKTIFKHDKRPCINCGDFVRWNDQSVPNIPDLRQQVVDERYAYQVVSMLQGVVERGTGRRIKAVGKPLAGKTGTTDESKDTWFIGFSPDLVAGVFVGFDTPRTLGNKETGSSVAVPIFKEFMEDARRAQPATPFRIPPGIHNVLINADTGARADSMSKRTIWEAFIAGTEPTDKTYILDGKGISLMPAVSGNIDSDTTSGTGGLY